MKKDQKQDFQTVNVKIVKQSPSEPKLVEVNARNVTPSKTEKEYKTVLVKRISKENSEE